MSKLILAIDTSNYTSSMAVVTVDGKVIFDERIMLKVPQGKRGLRQSEAVWMHMMNLPVIYEKISSNIDTGDIAAVSVSSKPRDVENSYMPVFKAGESFGKIIADTLNIPIYTFSHQLGHVKAIEKSNGLTESPFIALHLSGGTSESLLIERNNNIYNINILSQTLDISFGQLIDRVGVAGGLPFPAGKFMDSMALQKIESDDIKFKDISFKNGNFNLSGIETQCLKHIENGCHIRSIAYYLFEKISKAIDKIIDLSLELSADAREYNAGQIPIIVAGGVSESEFIREYLKSKKSNILFGKYGTDNAVGIGILGGEMWESSLQQSQN